jgi:hypothetical protein
LGGSRRFCVQCGRQLKPDSRFCVVCGRAASGAAPPGTAEAASEQVTTASGYTPTSAVPVSARDDSVDPSLPAMESTWPSKGSYRPADVAPKQTQRSFPPSSQEIPPQEFPPPTEEFPPPTEEFPPPTEEFPPPTDDFSPPVADADHLFGTGDRPPSPARSRRPPSPARSRRPPSRARSRRPPSQSRSRRPWTLAVALLVPAAIAAAVVFFVLRPSHGTQPSTGATATSAGARRNAQATTPAPSASSAPASSSAPISEQQAATNLAGLLGQSVSDRSSIQAAVNVVNTCGPALDQQPQIFQSDGASRQRLLSRLAGLSGRSALPAAMIQALTSGWQASAAADKDLGQWAEDEVAKGCIQNDQSDPSFKAATGPDGQATTEKKAFVSQWNSIASQYGLETYQWGQL